MVYLIRDFELALISLDYVKIRELCGRYRDPAILADELILPSLELIGNQWERGEISLAQVYMSGKICSEILNEMTVENEIVRKSSPRMAIAVFEDFHTLGKTIVYNSIKASGYEILDFGYGQQTDLLMERIIKEKVEILMLSVLMLPSALHIGAFINTLRENGCMAKVAVGGAPFRLDPDLWKEIGADAVGMNAFEAQKIVKTLSGGE